MADEKLISVSDVAKFKRCRYQWDLSSPLRQSWKHKRSPKLYLALGTAIHTGIDANAKGKDWEEELQNHFDEEYEKEQKAFFEEIGSYPIAFQAEEFRENCDTARNLLTQYFEQYGTENSLKDQGLEYVASELSFKIPLNPLLYPEYAGTEVFFVGTIDGVAIDSDGNIFLVEHKTYNGKPPEDLQFHAQITGYNAAWKWLTGAYATGALYNGLTKSLVRRPGVLKSGKLSVAKNQRVTFKSYTENMTETGQDPFDDYYFEFLHFLEERERQGDSRFFHREKFFYKQSQMDSWESEFLDTVRDMLDTDTSIYRTIPHDGCGDCWFSDLCHADMKGQDISPILERRYKTATYGTVEAVQAVDSDGTTMVTSVEGLLKTLRGTK